ncbi:N-6 DNA methylase [Novosphingobium sp.]|uniref:N-6 DNA methylase n=1 Tax=Novosphingobium sp. TaxID=1874826 RepID=UPI0025E39EB6|nr:N-6 DNA methylase [Novosphingobium sp.]
MGVLYNLANIFRSHKINDEATRYKETVKLILARYCDERAAKLSPHELALQVLPGCDPDFMKRVTDCYLVAAKRYQKAKTLFEINGGAPALPETAMREAVELIQGIEFTAASSDVMQQVFMSFVPAVFKKSLDQYFTSLPLIDAIVDMVAIGPNDTVADPAMGTADFLSAAMAVRQAAGDDDIANRLYGADADKMAFDLAIVNMILHKDGQSNFVNEDSIEQFDRWERQIGVALFNPPFGEKSLEKRSSVLSKYDLGHIWEVNSAGMWKKTKNIASSQELGILFIEKCFKLLDDNGRMAIILPEGYLCTSLYGYVREWIISNLKILALVELPRRIFNRADADLRANILIAQKLSVKDITHAIEFDYPIHAELIRKVGFKMGKGFSIEPKRDPKTGDVIRDAENEPIIDSDFLGLRERHSQFRDLLNLNLKSKSGSSSKKAIPGWSGSRISDIRNHPNLDMKPRRLTKKAVARRAAILSVDHFRLADVADVVSTYIDLQSLPNLGKEWRLVEGTSIRALEGTVVPQEAMQAWEIIDAKQRRVFKIHDGDIVVGLVRPERRNVGIVIDAAKDIVGTPDGVAIVRVKKGNERGITQEFLLAALRSEDCRIQLWTESGGTSYGKLNHDHILGLHIRQPTKADLQKITDSVRRWIKANRDSMTLWNSIGTPSDRKPILNSPMFGLEAE